jgi:hypothetical protein
VPRQQFAKMIVLTGGYPVTEANVCYFVDVEASGPSSFYPDNFVAVCAARGITTGKTPTTFDPTGKITRYQVVSMVVRAADDLDPELLANPSTGFAATGTWGNDPVHGANAARAEFNGLLAGLNLTVLDPYGDMARGEVAQVLHNLLGELPTTSTTGTLVPTSTSSSTTTTTAAFRFVLQTTVSGGGGSITRNPNQTDFNAGTSVVLTAVPAAGYRFAGWGGSASGTANPLTVVMDSSKTVSAAFTFAYADIGAIPSAPCVCRPRESLEWFWVTEHGWLARRTYDPVTGSGISVLDASVSLKVGSTPAVVCWPFAGGPRIDLVARGADNHLMWKSFTTTWSDWTDLSHVDPSGHLIPEVLSNPAICAAGSAATFDQLRLFFRTSDGALGEYRLSLHEDGSFAGSGLARWADVSSQFKAGSNPAVVSYAPGSIDLFTRGSNNHLWHRYAEGWEWSAWEDLGGALTTSPTATSRGVRRLDVFAGGPGSTLWYAGYNTTGWSMPVQVSTGVITSDPCAVASAEDRVDVLVRGSNSHLWHTWWDGSRWKP